MSRLPPRPIATVVQMPSWLYGGAPSTPVEDTTPKKKSVPKLKDIPMCVDVESECPVCLEGVDMLSLPCRHVLCFSCYSQLRTQNCPVCRAEIVQSFVRRLPKKH